jgi:chorismate mutase-like protein
MKRRNDGNLTKFRDAIDALDRTILQNLSDRFALCLEVAEHKKKHQIPMMQPTRVEQVVSTRCAWGGQLGMPSEFVMALYRLIIAEACRQEDEVIEGRPAGCLTAGPSRPGC